MNNQPPPGPYGPTQPPNQRPVFNPSQPFGNPNQYGVNPVTAGVGAGGELAYGFDGIRNVYV